MPRKKKEPSVALTPEELPLDNLYLDLSVDDCYSMYNSELHGELTDTDIETVVVKLAELFTKYTVYEITIKDVKLTNKLELMLDFMGLEVTKKQATEFNVARKEYADLLKRYAEIIASGRGIEGLNAS